MFCQLNIDFDATSATLRLQLKKSSHAYFGFLPQTILSSTPIITPFLNLISFCTQEELSVFYDSYFLENP